MNKRYVVSYNQVAKALCGKESATADEIIAAYEQVKREREAAVRDLAYLSDFCKTCKTCKYNHGNDVNDCGKYDCDTFNRYEWRGVCAENSAKHGEWLPDTKFGTDVLAGNTICSVCGKGTFGQPDYCPHCGAKMNGGDDNA